MIRADELFSQQPSIQPAQPVTGIRADDLFAQPTQPAQETLSQRRLRESAEVRDQLLERTDEMNKEDITKANIQQGYDRLSTELSNLDVMLEQTQQKIAQRDLMTQQKNAAFGKKTPELKPESQIEKLPFNVYFPKDEPSETQLFDNRINMFVDNMMKDVYGEKELERLKSTQKKEELFATRIAPALLMAYGAPLQVLAYETLGQAKNIIVSNVKGEKYNPLEVRMLSELIPEDVPPMVRTGTSIAEWISDIALIGALSEKAKQGLLKSTLKEIGQKAEQAGLKPTIEMSEDVFKTKVKQFAKQSTLEKEVSRWLKAKSLEIKPLPPTQAEGFEAGFKNIRPLLPSGEQPIPKTTVPITPKPAGIEPKQPVSAEIKGKGTPESLKIGEGEIKEPWQMTKEEGMQWAIKTGTREWQKMNPNQDLRYPVENYIKPYERNFLGYHKENIKNALIQGKPVPAEVLADYPDLKTTKPPVTPEPTPTNPLIEEAKKYKSAEEFVKSQGTPVYHGTDREFQGDEFSVEKLGSNTLASSAKKGFFFSPNKEVAMFYARNQKKYYDDLHSKVHKKSKDIQKNENISKDDAWEKALYKELKIDDPKNIKKKIDENKTQFRNETKKTNLDLRDDTLAWVSGLQQMPVKELNEMLLNRIISYKTEPELEYVVFNPDKSATRFNSYPEALEYAKKYRANVLDEFYKSRPGLVIKYLQNQSGTETAKKIQQRIDLITKYNKNYRELKRYFDKYAYSKQEYAGGDATSGEVWDGRKEKITPEIKEAFLSMKNPLVHWMTEGYRDVTFSKLIDIAINKGNDGLIIKNTLDPYRGDVHVVFNPSQIKTTSQLTDIWNKAHKGVEKPTTETSLTASARQAKAEGKTFEEWMEGQTILSHPENAKMPLFDKSFAIRKPSQIGGDSLFHETSSNNAFSLIAAQQEGAGLNVANDINFALGQKGKGVIIEFDKKQVFGDRGFARIIMKPATQFVGEKEFELGTGTIISPNKIKSVIIKQGVKTDTRLNKYLKRFFHSTIQEDGSIRFLPNTKIAQHRSIWEGAETTAKTEDLSILKEGEKKGVSVGEDKPKQKEPSRVTVDELEKSREKYGLAELSVDESKKWVNIFNQASTKTFESQAISQSILGKPRVLTNEEFAILALRKAELEDIINEYSEKAEKAIDTGNKVEQDRYSGVSATALLELDSITESLRYSNREAGRALNIIKVALEKEKEQYKIAKILQKAKLAKGKTLTSEEIAKFQELAQKIKVLEQKESDLNKQIETLEEQLSKKDAEQNFVKTVKSQVRKVKSENLSKERDYLFEQLGKIGYRLNDITGVTYESAKIISQLSINYFLSGIKDIEKIAEEITNKLPGVTKKDVYDSLGGRIKRTKAIVISDTKRQIIELKKQARLLGQIEDAYKGIFDKPTKKPLSSSKVVELKKKLKELKDAAEASIKNEERLKQILMKIDSVNDQIDRGVRISKKNQQIVPEDIKQAKQDLSEARRLLDANNKIVDLENQLKTGEFKVPVRVQRVVKRADLLEAQVKLSQLRREVREHIHRLRPRTGREIFVDIVSLPRELMATADFSAAGRQAAILSALNPIKTLKILKESVPAFFKQDKADEIDVLIKQHENHETRVKAGLKIKSLENIKFSDREEYFLSSLGEKIPLYGHVVKDSNRHMVSHLTLMRVMAFDRFLDSYPDATDEELKNWANYVNIASGIGDMGAFNKVASEMSIAFFSPRFSTSRIQMPYEVFKYKDTPRVRKEIAKNYMKFLAMVGFALWLAKLAGADVELNSESPDWLKIKIGNTRIDLWGGLQQPARLTVLYAMKTLNSFGVLQMKKNIDLFDATARFVRYKLAPAISFPLELMQGKNAVGQETNIFQSFANNITPMVAEDIYRTYKSNPVLGVILAPFILLGVGVNTYEYKKKEPKEEQKKESKKKESQSSSAFYQPRKSSKANMFFETVREQERRTRR